MKFRDLKKSLAENLQAVYLIEGEDAFLRENALRLIKERGLQEPDLNLTNLSGQEIKQDPESFLTAVQSYPFMSDKRYVVVRDYTPSATELKGKVIKRVFQEPIDTAVIVIVNSEKCEALKKLDFVTVVDCNKADEPLITSFIRNKAIKSGVVVSDGAIKSLLEYCSMDLTRINSEVEKLLSFVGDNAEISKEHVELLVNKDTDFEVYEFTEAVATKNFDKSFEILSELAQKSQDKQRLFISIYYHFRRLLHACLSKGTIKELAESLGVKEFVAKKAREQAGKFKAKRLKQICDKLSYYDGAFKSGEISVDTALFNSVLSAMME
ncbi:MAG: DNA polymerase III subunit delta [Clostridia bacterium]|nr:DNA polymerase III subunit delta [Clostridia bacterium]